MPSIKSILSILALGSVMVDNPMPQRVLANALRVVALVIVSAMLVGALFLAVIGFFYKLMIANGVIELYAVSYIIIAIAVVAAILVTYTIKRSKTLLEDVSTSVKKPVPLTTHLTNQAGTIAEAFLHGFLTKLNEKPDHTFDKPPVRMPDRY